MTETERAVRAILDGTKPTWWSEEIDKAGAEVKRLVAEGAEADAEDEEGAR